MIAALPRDEAPCDRLGMRCPLAVLVVLVCASGASGVLAQTPDDDEAHSLYDAGRRAFEAGRYDRALEDFQHAYALSPRAELLYNIGQAADRLRHDAEALDAFEQYLASPQADESLRAQIQGRIDVLRAAAAEHRAAAPPPEIASDAQPVSAPAPAIRDRSPELGLLVAGAVLVAGGIVMLALAGTENATVQNADRGSSWSDFSGHLDLANGLAIGGGVAVGLGAVGCVVGSVLFASSGPPDSAATASVSFGLGSISVRGTF